MTREEATQELTEWIKQMENHGVPPYSAKYKALKLAIETLQAEPTNKSGELFITLNKAVEVAVNQFNIDRVLARQEFEQKCYVPCSDYEKGFYDGLAKCRDIIEDAKAFDMAIEALQAEPVVHCRDCKHRHEYRNSEYIDCDCTDFYEMDDNDYCCFGERKEP